MKRNNTVRFDKMTIDVTQMILIDCAREAVIKEDQ